MKGMNALKFSCAVFVTALALCSARGADAYVAVTSSGFSPSSVSIGVGETVYFIVADDFAPYCIQSTTGAWTPWYLWENGDGVGIQFNQRGDYYYRDGFDYTHTGVVHVGTGGGNQAPLVTITSPADGAVFTEPAAFTFSADVSDPDNGLQVVEFYLDSSAVNSFHAGPYTMEITNLAAGPHTLIVTAYDNASVATEVSINITVLPGTPGITIGAPQVVGGQLTLEATGLTAGMQAVLEGSASLGPLASWAPLQTNTVVSTSVSFTQPVMAGSRFFRVAQQQP